MNTFLSGGLIVLEIVAYISCFYTVFGRRKRKEIGIREGIVLLLSFVLFTASIILFQGKYSIMIISGLAIAILIIPVVLDIDKKTYFALLVLIMPLTGIVGDLLTYVVYLSGIEDVWFSEIIVLIVMTALLWGFYLIKGKKLDNETFVLSRRICVLYGIVLVDISGMYSFFTHILRTSYRGSASILINMLLVLGGAVLVGATLFLIYYTNAKRKSEYEATLVKVQNEQQREYFLRLLEKETETRRYRHDEIDQLIQLQHYMENGDTNKARSLVGDMLQGINLISSEVYDVGNDIINTMLNYYLVPLKKYGYRIGVNGFLGRELSVSERDLCIIISNIIKNASEAVNTMKVNEGFINVELMRGNYSWGIKVTNSTLNGEKKRTTKSDKLNHGFGLDNVRKIVSKYGGSFEISLVDMIFSAEVVMSD